MNELDFSQIRNHDGSQNNGFEELVCQLAHLSPPDNADYFVRKEGAGGDAGVECYWVLSDGAEHGWQAKYFLNTVDANQWSQITESVETALNKHPNLTKYYVCLPRDWTDSRKKGRGGKTITSAWDKWVSHVNKWEEIASDRGMKVTFSYWCKHELVLMLQRDLADFSGRARYWFGAPVLTHDVFERLVQKSRLALGDRYTPEYHLDLPIAEVFNALGNTESWWRIIEEHVTQWTEHSSKAEKAILSALDKTGKDTGIREHIDSISQNMASGLNDKTFIDEIELYIKQLDELSAEIQDIVNTLLDVSDEGNGYVFDSIRRDFYQFESTSRKLINFLKSESCKSSKTRNVLLVGEAGIGKSHLLCDVSLSRIENKLPTVFLLGQHYTGGNPLSTLKDALDLADVGSEEFLGALDASGEAYKTNVLIVIDAINEGNNRDDWPHQLSSLLSDFSRFRHISLVISCRTTYIDWLIPDGLIGDTLIKVAHHGFKGYEHRAASKYLSQQGIVKPSAPITSPEFTNPLFLKTCCKAMREQGMTAFPKGLHGISSLLDFYLDSVEKTILRRKHYRAGEKVVHKAVESFAYALYPDHQFGLPMNKAVALINDFDTRPNQGDTLFDTLIDEGVLSEDMEVDAKSGRRTNPVVRFTYERFSDYLIANSLLENVTDKDVTGYFLKGGKYSLITEEKSYYKYAGILAALNIIVAEKYDLELIDILPEEITEDQWLFDQVFVDTLQWRSPASFSDRTLELLNKIPNHGFHSTSIDAILKLSTEPGHPWNADLIHRNLLRRSMPERDVFWSTHITISDYEESDNEQESVLRAIIDWAQYGVLDNIEAERIRLCSIVLIWMTSSTNRKVRDQATKAVVRMLTVCPELLISLLEQFHDIDDLYVVERLYAITYGVVTNINDDRLISNTANWVYTSLFENGEPTPHILLRDYARGIMEYAYFKGLLDDVANPQIFRPPYKSPWPLNDPSEQEITDLIGDEFSSSIKSSIMGFPGDFGNYIMSRIHDWSPTPIDHAEPQTAHELQMEFSKSLNAELKAKFVKYLEIKKEQDSRPFNLKGVLNRSATKSKVEKKPTELDLLKKEIEESLSAEEKENFRWVMGLGRADSVGSFSRKKAHRWVCKRAIDLGWTKERFDDFERYHTGSHDRSESKIERIGKKYQWIAFHEFLAHVADNCSYIDKGYSDVDSSKYYGPWQLHKRNIDPTHWIRKTGDSGWDKWEKEFWWQPFVYPISDGTLDELQDWLWDEKIVPPFNKLLQVNDSVNKNWLVLKSFSNWRKDQKEDKESIPNQDAWYRINSCVIPKDQFDVVEKHLKGLNLCDPDVLSSYSTGHQGFLREYPWHPIYVDIESWNNDLGYRLECPVKNHIPVAEYEWESGSTDSSVENSISIFLPSKEIIAQLNLSPDLINAGRWLDDNGDTIFTDPCMENEGPSSALINKDRLLTWLDSNDLQLVWLVGGEKGLYTHWATKFFGRLVYSGIYKLDKNGITGNLWYLREKPSQ